MKNSAKLIVLSLFALAAAFTLISCGTSGVGGFTLASATAQATPTPAGNAAANTASNTKPAGAPADKKIRKSFTLGQDSASQYGEVAFDHETHAVGKYSPDGKSVIGCVECHHTDQPKSALKPPLVTSERDVVLTMATFQASNQKVNECRSCHFQEGNVPDGKTMPSATYTEGGKSKVKELNNELAYHLNCNTCHDAAAAARPELKKKPGFGTSKDCTICHKSN